MFRTLLKQLFSRNVKLPENNLRFNDATLLINQDNSKKSILIEASNTLVLSLLGFNTDEINKHDLREFLPDEIKETINDNIEFSDDSKSVDEVLKKISNFKLKTSAGGFVPLQLRVIRSLSKANEHKFQLVMKDRSLLLSLNSSRDNFKKSHPQIDMIDESTNLISKDYILRDIDFIAEHTARNSTTESSIVIVKLVGFNGIKKALGESGAKEMLTRLIEQVRNSKRSEDICGFLGDGTICFIFPETPFSNADIPLERIRAAISDDLIDEVEFYKSPITVGLSAKEILDKTLNS